MSIRTLPEGLRVHTAGPDDDSPNFGTGGANYGPRPGDSRCGWCYLGANHSFAEHLRQVPDTPCPLVIGPNPCPNPAETWIFGPYGAELCCWECRIVWEAEEGR